MEVGIVNKIKYSHNIASRLENSHMKTHMLKLVLLFLNLWYSYSGNQPEQNLARFGYKKFKSKRNQSSFYILSYLLEVQIESGELFC